MHFLLALPIVILGAAAQPVPDEKTLDALSRALLAPQAKVRLSAASDISHLPASGIELYVKRLFVTEGVSPGALATLLLEAGAQIPNPDYPAKGELWLRKPPPARPRVKKGQPRPPRVVVPDPEALDWLTALANFDLEASAATRDLPQREMVRARALGAVAWMRALASSERPEAAEPLFKLGFLEEGVFRDETGRALRRLGSYAVPTLIVHAYDISRKMGKQRRYAAYQLDRMDCGRPHRAMAMAANDVIRAEIIHAYGEMRAIDAVDAILRQVDAPSRKVRKEARWAWLRYVTGPPPRPVPMRKRKLPGGKEEDEPKEDYLNYRELAILALERQLEAIHGVPTQPERSPEEMTQEVFSYYDEQLAKKWETIFLGALEKRRQGDLAGAAQDFSRILADDPFYQRRAAMSETYLALGEVRRAQGKLFEAVALFRQAADLLPPGEAAARQATVQADLLEGLQRLAQGEEDRAIFLRALAGNPSLQEARQALSRIDGRHVSKVRRQQALLVGILLLCGLILGVGLTWLGRRRRNKLIV